MKTELHNMQTLEFDISSLLPKEGEQGADTAAPDLGLDFITLMADITPQTAGLPSLQPLMYVLIFLMMRFSDDLLSLRMRRQMRERMRRIHGPRMMLALRRRASILLLLQRSKQSFRWRQTFASRFVRPCGSIVHLAISGRDQQLIGPSSNTGPARDPPSISGGHSSGQDLINPSFGING